ncbi:DUF3662 domain-containing protein [Streptomyces libani]|uniref:DUF3662 domain-containing protein n=2 Tax=Streptomyces nigrescens TaxID=1920 RepID=A0A640TYN4_STRNI|nr:MULTISPECIES: DUF3662 domain-containing protein [Streptomyces]MCW7988595.1 forkhead-associated protein [Streptomyces platensis subsp. clarensis]AWN25241.1 DUF2662 domain-containing protein [Streptomyces sp. NEAU-S7GS2]MCX5444203.1 DUF3662 domain-containing protein [Streptomyces libani]MYT11365.1 DUF3662 domain-containing protein [Streptomyces sp. SID4951]WAU01264.1 DUF3662 domain-containing protein [Streptomyces libani subsp. libani]
MGMLRRWERVVEDCESALLAKIFRTDPVELFDALRQECDAHAVVCSQSRVLVPNDYTVELAPQVHDELAARGGEVGRQLTDVLARHAVDRGYEGAGPLTVHVTTGDVPNGRYRISSAALAHIPADAAGPRAT